MLLFPQIPAGPSLRGHVVLVADHNVGARQHLAGFYRSLGASVIEADNASSFSIALQQAEQLTMSIVDANFAELDGIVLLEMLRAGDRTHGIILIASAASPDAKAVKRAEKAGVHAFLAKPCSLAAMKAVTIRALEKHRRLHLGGGATFSAAQRIA